MSREGMSIETAVTGLMVITPKLARVLIWVVFTVIHLVLLVALSLVFWWFQVSPAEIQTWAASLSHSSIAYSTVGIITFAGLSGFALLWGYAKAWRWLLHKLLNAFLFANNV